MEYCLQIILPENPMLIKNTIRKKHVKKENEICMHYRPRLDAL